MIYNNLHKAQGFNMRSFYFRTNKIKLSVRETQVFAGVILGMTAKQIGQILFLSPRTIEFYIENLKNKFHGLCRYKMISYALANDFPIYKFLYAFNQMNEEGYLKLTMEEPL